MNEILEHICEDVIPKIRSGQFRLLPEQLEMPIDPHGFIELVLPYPQTHPHFELAFLVKGSAHMRIENVIYRLNEGDCCLLPPGTSHADVYDRSTVAYRLLWINYSIATMDVTLFDYEPFGQWKLGSNFYFESIQDLGILFEALRREMIGREEGAHDAITGMMLQLLVLVKRSLIALSNSEISYPRYGKISYDILHILMQRYPDPLTLDEIAGAIHLSPHYVATKFRWETGFTIFEKLAEIRIERAVRLLLEREVPLEQIATAVGYKTVDQFSRTFRKLKGVSPSRYGQLAYMSLLSQPRRPRSPLKKT